MQLLYNYEGRPRSNFLKYIIVIIVTIVITLFVNRTVKEANEIDEFAEKLSFDSSDITNSIGQSQTKSVSNCIENVLKSTVGISLITPNGDSIFDINVAEKWGIGTGIIISENGYILTNQHLARKEGAQIIITLNTGKEVQGKVVWAEEYIDLAIIKIEERGLIPVKFGNSETIKVGEDVIAIGNPLGIEFQGTTTKGIISGLDRTIKFVENEEEVFMEGLIQTDASINPGNSGGPLINESGEVIGINTVKITSAEGIGFAVPINIVKNVINSFILEDKFDEAALGIYAYDSEAIRYMDKKRNFNKGIYVVNINPYGPCGKIDLKNGDIITHIDGIEINKMNELREYLYSKAPGEKVILNVEDGVQKKLEVFLQKK